MKNYLLRLSTLYLLFILGITQNAQAAEFKDFAVQLSNDDIFDTSTNKFGVKVVADGTYTATAFDDATATFTVNSARWNDKQHGWVNCVFTVKVDGPVKVGLGNCKYGSQDGTIKDAAGNSTALTVGNANCWNSNDIAGTTSYTLYKGIEATTLTITYNGYCPYISVEAVDPSQLASDATVSFAAGEATDATVPVAIKGEVGSKITLPKNFTMYVAGKTLTGWSDGVNSYAPGTEYTIPENDIELTPLFTANTVTLADRTAEVTVMWSFRRDAGAPSVQWQNKDGLVWVAQATIGDKTIDVALPFSTNPGKFNNTSWNDWCQLNEGTTFHVPSCKGATVSIEAYNELTKTSIDGQTDYTSGKTISYTVANSAETVDVVIGSDGSYYRYIKVVLPVVQSVGGESYDNVDATITWPLLTTDGAFDASSHAETPDGAFSVVSFEHNAATTGVQARSKDPDSGMKFATFKGDNVQLHWNIKPAKGLTFTPTQIKMNIQRFGTNKKDGVVITAKVGEGEVQTLGTYTARRANWDDAQEEGQWGEKLSNLTNEAVIDLTEAQQVALASGEGFDLYAITGLANNKDGGFANIRIYGKVNGTKASVDMYTLAIATSPEEGGSVSAYPKADEYEAGSEVTLTATDNFGYDFMNWTNASGEEVSTEAKFKYTINANETLTANFKKVNTYELALTVDGTNDYMVTINPAPTVVDGKNMYEAGSTVELNANQYEDLVTFTNWSDGETASNKIVRIEDNVTLTAVYAQADIIAGWDFYKAGANGRKADFAAADNDADALNLVETATGNTSGWLDKSTLGGGGYESFAGAAVNWRTGEKDGDVGNWHWQTKVNAEAFTDINVQFQMLYNYNAYQTYDAEYSLDGEQWIKFGSVTMTGAKQVGSFSQKLPEAANNQANLYIRMKADKTSNVDGAASKNDGNTLTMFFITGTPQLVNDGQAPVLMSTVPANGATGASATGKIVLTFDERVKMADDAVAYINNTLIKSITQNPTKGTISGKTITFEYKGLEYATEYRFILPANSVSDLTDNMLDKAIEISFTTMERPSINKVLYDIVVENTDQLVAAIKTANTRADQNTRFRIYIKKGTYTIPLSSTMKTCNGYDVPECITFINGNNISFIGEDRDATIITNGIPADATFAGTYGTTSKYDGIGNSDVFQTRGTALYWQDLTIESGMQDATGRDLAVHDKGTKTIYKNVALRGYQDTWTSNNDRGLYYFEGGYVRGRTDYMCGKGDAFFNGVELRQIAGGYAAVPSKPANIGWVYKDCVINGEGSGVDGNYTLGRPWGQGTPVALFIDTKMNVVPSAIGWNEMSGGWPARFAEYNSTTSTGSVIDLSGRKKTFGDGHENNPVLTAEEALEYSDMSKMFGDWQPTLATEQAPLPTNVKISGTTLTWDDSNYALLWAIVKDNTVIDFTTEPTYTVDDASATYAVRAANEMGGLSEATIAGVFTGIAEITNNQHETTNAQPFNLNGQPVNDSYKGLVIAHGKKMIKK